MDDRPSSSLDQQFPMLSWDEPSPPDSLIASQLARYKKAMMRPAIRPKRPPTKMTHRKVLKQYPDDTKGR